MTANREKEDTAGDVRASSGLGSENVGGKWKQRCRKEEIRDGKKEGRRDKSRPSARAGKENIRSPFIFINKTSRRVRSGGNQDAPLGGTSCNCGIWRRRSEKEVFAMEETRQMR